MFKKIDSREIQKFGESKKAFVTIMSQNVVYISGAAMRQIKNDSEKVVVMIDTEARAVALCPANKNDPTAFNFVVASGKTATSRKITGIKLVKMLLDIGFDYKTRYLAKAEKVHTGGRGMVGSLVVSADNVLSN